MRSPPLNQNIRHTANEDCKNTKRLTMIIFNLNLFSIQNIDNSQQDTEQKNRNLPHSFQKPNSLQIAVWLTIIATGLMEIWEFLQNLN